MNTLIVLVAIVAAVAAAPQKEASDKAFSFSTGPYPAASQEYFPGQGFQGFRGVYPAQPAYYPGYQGFQGFQGYYPGFQGYYPGYQGYNSVDRGYYPVAPVAPVVQASYPAVTPAPYVAPVQGAPVPVAPKFTPVAPTYTPVAPKYTPVAPAAVSPVYKPASVVNTKTPVIVKQSQEVDFDGNFKYGYETDNGIVTQAAGYVKNAGTENAVQVIEGSYAYVADDGTPVEVKYYADETGYHAVGNVVPTTPPEIAKSLEYLASQPQKPEDSRK